MTRELMKKYFAIFFFILLFTPVFALAQSQAVNPCSLQGVKASPDQDASSTLPRCINQIYTWSLGVGALLALLMIVIGGYYFMTSSGNAERASKGKEYINSALIGLVILFCAYLILNEINPDFVNFNLKSIKGLNSAVEPAPLTTPRN